MYNNKNSTLEQSFLISIYELECAKLRIHRTISYEKKYLKTFNIINYIILQIWDP